jgi:hypothetical protein
VPIENIEHVTAQCSKAITLEYVAAAALEDHLPLLEIAK